MMNLLGLLQRAPIPEPWAEGDNIPWNDAEFSSRMLREHLSQEHDLASRKSETIDRHVEWIHTVLLKRSPARILDLGCGPGLYASRLARLGHTCVGIDYGPAAVAYAAQQAKDQNLDCLYLQQDIRLAEYGTGFDLVMQIYGEINVFRPQDARTILRKAKAALKPGGLLLLEASTFALTEQTGREPATWFTSQSGLFSANAHMCLMENFWDLRQRNVATVRYFIVDLETGEVTRYAQSMQAYREEDYRGLLAECGFEQIEVLPGMALQAGDDPHPEFCALLAVG
jgi:2-polyprenyl-3-methyl-5-hydroxy-6-metoxy-1,4-benzoquinol methylase